MRVTQTVSILVRDTEGYKYLLGDIFIHLGEEFLLCRDDAKIVIFILVKKKGGKRIKARKRTDRQTYR